MPQSLAVRPMKDSVTLARVREIVEQFAERDQQAKSLPPFITSLREKPGLRPFRIGCAPELARLCGRSQRSYIAIKPWLRKPSRKGETL